MTAAVLEARPPSMADARGGAGARARRQTLEERLERSWRALVADGQAECPVCRASMQRVGAAGECGGCGSALS